MAALADAGGKISMRPGGEEKVVAHLMRLLFGDADAGAIEHALGEVAHFSALLKQRGSIAAADSLANAVRSFVAQLQTLASERKSLQQNVADRTQRKIHSLLGGPDARKPVSAEGPTMNPLTVRLKR